MGLARINLPHTRSVLYLGRGGDTFGRSPTRVPFSRTLHAAVRRPRATVSALRSGLQLGKQRWPSLGAVLVRHARETVGHKSPVCLERRQSTSLRCISPADVSYCRCALAIAPSTTHTLDDPPDAGRTSAGARNEGPPLDRAAPSDRCSDTGRSPTHMRDTQLFGSLPPNTITWPGRSKHEAGGTCLLGHAQLRATCRL